MQQPWIPQTEKKKNGFLCPPNSLDSSYQCQQDCQSGSLWIITEEEHPSKENWTEVLHLEDFKAFCIFYTYTNWCKNSRRKWRIHSSHQTQTAQTWKPMCNIERCCSVIRSPSHTLFHLRYTLLACTCVPYWVLHEQTAPSLPILHTGHSVMLTCNILSLCMHYKLHTSIYFKALLLLIEAFCYLLCLNPSLPYSKECC